MLGMRVVGAVALVAAIVFSSTAMAQIGGAANQPTEAQKKAEADRKAAETKPSYEGYFQSEVLAGNTVNDFRVPQPPAQLIQFNSTLTWTKTGYETNRHICSPPDNSISVASKTPQRDNVNSTVLGIRIAKPPCLWPLRQIASIKISADTKDGLQILFDGQMSVSVFWFPAALTLLILVLIYPGCAAASWYASRRRYRKVLASAKPGEAVGKAPTFLAALDPVELTKNPYGRGSIAKLQIFLFSFIVFGLLLFHVMRTGLLANMSMDVLYLMGISALGAGGGKIAYIARRRLKLENWVWLRRKGWLAPLSDVADRAKWSDLFVDSDTKEFDPYRFQMAIFSLVVAMALITSSASGLEAFKIPAELLGLLGISQTVFIAGQAIDKGGYKELDEAIDKVREDERKYQELKIAADDAKRAADTPPKVGPAAPNVDSAAVKADPAAPEQRPAPAETPTNVKIALQTFKNDAAQAAEMFWAIYGQQLGTAMPEALRNIRAIEPDLHDKAAV